MGENVSELGTSAGEGPAESNQVAKYGVVGAGGALVGGAFSFGLFQALGVNGLLKQASTTLTMIYAVMAFSMVACIVLGTGYFAVPNDRIGQRSRLFNAITVTFLGLAVGCVAYLMFFQPTVRVPIVVEDFKGRYLSYALQPYIEYPPYKDLTDKENDDTSRVMLTDSSFVRVFVKGLDKLEGAADELKTLCTTRQLDLNLSPSCQRYSPSETPQLKIAAGDQP
jgi:hypothetical protein